jgi:hypothetical protein
MKRKALPQSILYLIVCLSTLMFISIIRSFIPVSSIKYFNLSILLIVSISLAMVLILKMKQNKLPYALVFVILFLIFLALSIVKMYFD